MAELAKAEKLLKCQGLDCRPPAEAAPEPAIPSQPQAIDYLAKDYDSFLRAMLDLLPQRVPGWKDRTEADLGMALLELFAYLGDQLSYYQDRVANEGFLRTALQFDSVRRLLSLVDYSPYPGNAARAWIAFTTSAAVYLPAGFQVRSRPAEGREPVVFETEQSRVISPELNSIALALPAPSNTEGNQIVLAGEFEGYLAQGFWLLIESGEQREWGRVASPLSVDLATHRTTVTLASPLRASYPVAGVTLCGNGIPATHGESRVQEETATGLPNQSITLGFGPLTYVLDEQGKVHSSLEVSVDGAPWSQVEDFIGSGVADAHFRTSRDREGFVTVHFGDGLRGRVPAQGDRIRVRYRTGIGESGMVAAGVLTEFRDPNGVLTSARNPLPSDGARDPETAEEAKLVGPRRLRRQERAVIPRDYEEILLRGVAVGSARFKPLHAKARFRWTGSWRTVFVSVDMPDRRPLAATPGLREAFEAALEERKLAGYDVRVEDARYAPLHIALIVHVKPSFFARHVRSQVEKVLGSRTFPDGAVGFFAPGRFAFGQAVHLSDLYATAMAVEGVQAISVTRFKRLGDRYPDREQQGFIEIDPLEIVRCDHDPRHPENGILYLRTCGGKEG